MFREVKWFTQGLRICKSLRQLSNTSWLSNTQNLIWRDLFLCCPESYSHLLDIWSGERVRRHFVCLFFYNFQVLLPLMQEERYMNDIMSTQRFSWRTNSKSDSIGLPWWLRGRIHPPMQETQFQFLIQEDPTCLSLFSATEETTAIRSLYNAIKSSPRSLQEKSLHSSNKDLVQPKVNQF